jgi:glucuronate isomerase
MRQSHELEQRLLEQVMRIPAVDVHSHVPAEAPFARSLRDLLGYHYFTELAHSAGMDKSVIDPKNPDDQMIPALVDAMATFDNTVQYAWMIELAQTLFGFKHRRLTGENWRELADAVASRAAQKGRDREILNASRIEKVFLTNSFDDRLDAIDREIFVPSLRADTLVFQLSNPKVRRSLTDVSGIDIEKASHLRDAVGKVFERFKAAGALSAAISLPPQFRIFPVMESDMDTAAGKVAAGKPLSTTENMCLQSGMLFTVAEFCRQYRFPFQVMVGAVRGAYHHGVPQGTDLPQAGDSLRGLLPLLNAFPDVTFCISVLSDTQAHELASYGWIVRNVVVSGHWWYSTPAAYIERDLTARLQSVPKTKLIGYYSDMYKLEFGLPKFNMYRRMLARVLARDYVEMGRGTEEDAVALARLLLRENAVRIFGLQGA